MPVEVEASRIGLGNFYYAGANGFTSSTLLQLLAASNPAYAGADLPGALALGVNSVLSGALGTDPTILTSFDIRVNLGFFYFRQDGAAATNHDTPVQLGEILKVRDMTMAELKKYTFFCDAGTTFDLRIQLMG